MPQKIANNVQSYSSSNYGQCCTLVYGNSELKCISECFIGVWSFSTGIQLYINVSYKEVQHLPVRTGSTTLPDGPIQFCLTRHISFSSLQAAEWKVRQCLVSDPGSSPCFVLMSSANHFTSLTLRFLLYKMWVIILPPETIMIINNTVYLKCLAPEKYEVLFLPDIDRAL